MSTTSFIEATNNSNIDPKNYLINYNELYCDATPILYRDQVTQSMLSCLIGKTKPNALLVGAAGVGKTKIVADFARRIANKDDTLPTKLKGYTVWELPLSNIVSGSSFVGALEEKLQSIISFAEDSTNKAILFIDEIHLIVSDNQMYSKIAEILKPALARGKMHVIGATTLQECQALVDNPAFHRRFTRLIVDELSKEDTKNILVSMMRDFEIHYRKPIILTDQLLTEIVEVADEYKSIASHRPDNAITLLDRALADNIIQQPSASTLQLTRGHLLQTAMRILTGNNEKYETNVSSLMQDLSRIKGQDKIIESIVDSIKRDALGLYPRTKPLTFLFAGSSGVGKSEIAKILSQNLTHTKPITLNMTEFHHASSINRIIGSPVGYIGSDSKAELPFDILESNPYQVILLDEFEKCDNAVQRLFMSAFEDGYIKTAKGKLVDFSKSIIIATTNAGYHTINHQVGFSHNTSSSIKEDVSKLSNFFDLALLNRFTKIIHFQSISETIFMDITKETYKRLVTDIKMRNTAYSFLPDALSDSAVNDICKAHYLPEFGARPVEKAVKEYIEQYIMSKEGKI